MRHLARVHGVTAGRRRDSGMGCHQVLERAGGREPRHCDEQQGRRQLVRYPLHLRPFPPASAPGPRTEPRSLILYPRHPSLPSTHTHQRSLVCLRPSPTSRQVLGFSQLLLLAHGERRETGLLLTAAAHVETVVERVNMAAASMILVRPCDSSYSHCEPSERDFARLSH